MISSLRCYTGTDKLCIVSFDTNDCGDGNTCQCVKYRFQCTSDDQACDAEEKSSGTIKWAYAVVSKSTCNQMKISYSGYMNTECCAKDKCNRPTSGKCSWSQARRRNMRRLTNLIELD